MSEDNGKVRLKEITAERRKRKLMVRVKKHNFVLLAAFFLMIICFNVFGLLTKDVDFSENENRAMAQRPDFSWTSVMDGSYGRSWESYITDQFFGRKSWITLKLDIDKIFGKKESNGVYLGRSGYLMEVPAEPDPVWFDKNLEAVNDFAGRHTDIHMFMTVVPNAAYVLSDYMPKHAPVRDQSADIKTITDKLSGGVTFLDVTKVMESHQDEGIYYKTDHHWTSLGAYYAFNGMAEAMGITDAVSDYDIYTVTDSFSGTMASKSGYYSSSDEVQLYTPKTDNSSFLVNYADSGTETCSLYDSSALSAKDKYTVFFGGNHPRIDIKSTNNNNKCLLLIKDSYANSFVQFLTPYYEHIIMIDPRYYYDDLEQVISKEGVTDVLFLYNLNTYLEDKSLADTLTVMEEEPMNTSVVTESESGDESDSAQNASEETQPAETETSDTADESGAE